MKKFWFSLPGWAQGVIAVTATAAVVGGGIAIAIKIKNKANNENAKKETDAALTEAKQLEQKGVKSTLTKSQLETICNQIEGALNGPTEDEAAIYRAFANAKTDVDILNLKATFGIRTTGYFIWSTFTGTLSQQLTYYFDVEEMKALNDLLARKGITYRF